MDWHSRYVLAWRLSNTLETGFCTDALGDALNQGTPEVFNTDQGSQFSSREFTQILQEHSVRISMDGRGRYQDNIFVERLWRTVKYEEVYLKAYGNGIEARRGLQEYFRFYNDRRPHQALGYRTPAEVLVILRLGFVKCIIAKHSVYTRQVTQLPFSAPTNDDDPFRYLIRNYSRPPIAGVELSQEDASGESPGTPEA